MFSRSCLTEQIIPIVVAMTLASLNVHCSASMNVLTTNKSQGKAANMAALTAGSGSVTAPAASPASAPHDTVLLNKPISTSIDTASSGIVYTVVDPSQTVPKLADRYYVASTLTQVFGPTVNPLLSSFVSPNADTLGAPCDRYGHPGVFDCPVTPSFSQAPVNPVSTASRAAYVTQTCEGVAAVNGAVQFAAAQVTKENIAQVAPNAADINNLYSLFYRFRAPTAGEQAGLISLAQAALAVPGTTPLDAWRYVLLALCLAPRWQLY